MTTYNADQQQRRDTAAGWTSADTVLKAGEIGVETDTGKKKVGDGAAAWTALGYDIAAYDADDLSYDNASSGLSSTTVQDAIDEVSATSGGGSPQVNAEVAGPLWSKLAAGYQGARIVNLGDSTGNDGNEWFNDTMEWLATRFPDHTVGYHLWSDADKLYGGATILQTGTAGRRYMSSSDATTKWAESADAAALDTTDLDIRCRIATSDWTPGADKDLIAREAGDPNRWAWVQVRPTGVLRFFWFPDGTYANRISAESTAAVTSVVSDGEALTFRVTLDVDNGAGGYDVKFYTSDDDGETWTQLGATVTGGSTTSLPSVAAKWQTGRNAGNGVAGDFYWFEQRASIGGGIVARWDASEWSDVDTSVDDIAGVTWTVTGAPTFTGALGVTCLNGSKGGQDLSYTNTNVDGLVPDDLDPDLVFINLGHNEGAATSMRTDYKTLTDAIVAKYADVRIVAIIQNPQTDAATNPVPHAIRQAELRTFAVTERFGIVDVMRAFFEYGDWSADLMTDTVHPNAAGTTVWVDAVKELLQAA